MTTDVGGNRELVENDRDGLLVPFWAENEFLAAVHRALEENWDREAISRRARRVTWEQTTADVVAEFQRVVTPIDSAQARLQVI